MFVILFFNTSLQQLLFHRLRLLGMRSKEVGQFLLAVNAAEETFYLNLSLQLHQAIEHGLGTRRTTRDIHIDWYQLIYAVNHAIRSLERPARNGTTATSYGILGFGKLFPQANESRSHTVHDGSLHHYIVGLACRVAGNLKTKPCHVVACGTQMHEFYSAATGTKAQRPQRICTTPVYKLVELSDYNVGTACIKFFDEFINIFVILEVFALHAFYLYFHCKAPFRQA